MAATVGKLVATLTANTKPYQAGMNRASKATRTFSQQIARMGKATAALSAAALTAAAFAMQRMVREQLQVIDATTKMARSLGIATEHLIGLQHAAGIAGVEQKELATALRRLQKNVSDATLGLTTAIRAFDSLGLSAENLIGLTPHKALLLVADALSKMQNPMERTRVALDLFGRSGVKLIEMMKDGAAGLEAFQREAEALGLTFSDLEGQKIEAANDAILRMKKAFTGMARTMTIDFAPRLEQIAKTIQMMAPQIARVAVQTAKWAAIILGLVVAYKAASIATTIFLSLSGPQGWAVLAGAAAVAAIAIAKVKGAFDDAALGARSFKDATDGVQRSTDSIADKMAVLRREIQKQIEVQQRLQGFADNIIGNIGPRLTRWIEENRQALAGLRAEFAGLNAVMITDKVAAFAQAIIDQTAAIGNTSLALEINKLAIEGATAAQLDMLRGLERELDLRKKLASDVALANRLIEQALTPLERFIRDKDRLLRALNEEGITQDEYAKALRQLTKEYNEAAEAGKGLQKQIEGIGAATAAFDESSRRGEFRQVQSFKRLGLTAAGDRVGATRRTVERETLKLLKKFDERMRRMEENQRKPLLLQWDN